MSHEMGHCMGFGHEFNRADWTDACHSSDGSTRGNDVGTPADVNSVMAAMGYCTHNQRISYWDEIGSQKIYGFRNMFADVTGDGREDAVVVLGDQLMVRPANDRSTGFSGGSDWTGNSYFYGDKGTFLADVSGDGLADLVMLNDTHVWVRKSTGTAFGAPRTWTDSGAWGTLESHFADFTGDCKADAIFINDTETLVRPPNAANTGLQGGFSVGPSRISTIERTVFANVSHAGAAKGCWADALYFDESGIWVATSNGSTLSTPTNWSQGQPVRGSRATLVADVTGDGLSDVISVNTNEIYVYVSLGNAFAPAVQWETTVGQLGTRGVFASDVNGNGKADLVMVGSDRIRVATSNGSWFGSSAFWTASPYYGAQLTF